MCRRPLRVAPDQAARLRVAALEQERRDGEQSDRPEREDPIPLPRRQEVVGSLRRLSDQVPGFGRQVGVDVVADAARQQLGERRQHEDESDHAGDGRSRVPHDGADREGEQAEHREVQTTADHGSQHAGIAERHQI